MSSEHTRRMIRARTNAPDAYDYGYTHEVSREPEFIGGRTIEVRTVEIPEEGFEYQTNRYRSGLYFVNQMESES